MSSETFLSNESSSLHFKIACTYRGHLKIGLTWFFVLSGDPHESEKSVPFDPNKQNDPIQFQPC